MKIQTSKNSGVLGSALLITLCTAIIIGLTLASYLILVQTQSANVERSQKWNGALVVTEAGVEDALELVNKYALTRHLDDWTNNYSVDGWTANGNVYSVTRYLNNASNIYYTVRITNVYNVAASNWAPVISAKGYVPALTAQASSQTFFAAAGLPVNGASVIVRRVDVQTYRDPLLKYAFAAQKQITMNGNQEEVNSFDSSDPNFSNNGIYTNDPAKIRDHGDVVSNGTITNIISTGNASIMGHVATGPNGTVSVGPNGAIGSKSYVSNPANAGTIQSGYASSDMNVDFPKVPNPIDVYGSTGWFPSLPPGGTVNGVSYNHIITSSGKYQIGSLGSGSGDSIYIATNASVVMYVTGSVNNYGKTIDIAPEGASLTMYLTGPFGEQGSGAINNFSQKAENLSILGLPTCTSINLGGQASFTGTIYAPQAAFSIGGGGSTPYDLVGSVMANTITLNGHFRAHYDEALRKKGIATWFHYFGLEGIFAIGNVISLAWALLRWSAVFVSQAAQN